MKEERDEERLKDKTRCNWKVGVKSENGRENRKHNQSVARPPIGPLN